MTCTKKAVGFSLLLALTSGCRDDDAAPVPKRKASEQVTFKKQVVQKPVRYTDEAGNLLPSGEKILWFEVPKGFTRNDNGRVHVLNAKDIELAKLEEYVAARVLARKFNRVARGGSYIEARSPEDPKRPPLDITISAGFQPGEVFLRVTEYMPVVGTPMTIDQAKSALLQDQKQAE